MYTTWLLWLKWEQLQWLFREKWCCRRKTTDLARWNLVLVETYIFRILMVKMWARRGRMAVTTRSFASCHLIKFVCLKLNCDCTRHPLTAIIWIRCWRAVCHYPLPTQGTFTSHLWSNYIRQVVLIEYPSHAHFVQCMQWICLSFVCQASFYLTATRWSSRCQAHRGSDWFEFGVVML